MPGGGSNRHCQIRPTIEERVASGVPAHARQGKLRTAAKVNFFQFASAGPRPVFDAVKDTELTTKTGGRKRKSIKRKGSGRELETIGGGCHPKEGGGKMKKIDIFHRRICRFIFFVYLCTTIKPKRLSSDGAIAQLVEQRTENPCVPGSIPGGTTLKRIKKLQSPDFQTKSGLLFSPEDAKTGLSLIITFDPLFLSRKDCAAPVPLPSYCRTNRRSPRTTPGGRDRFYHTIATNR